MVKYTKRHALKVLNKFDLDIDDLKFDINDLVEGLRVEMEHGKNMKYPFLNVTNNNLYKTGKIALAHLFERPDYYIILKKVGL